jgi:hypothetical protein
MVQREIQRMVLAADFSAADARMLIAALEETRPRSEGLADAIRFDHVYFATKTLPNLRRPLLMKRRLMERLHADFSRSYIELVEADWATIEARAPKVEEVHVGSWQYLFPGDWLPDATFLGRRLYHNSAISVTQAAIALRRYEQEHQALPPTLSDLVPNYIPSVPIDYYDKNEIRYAPELRALWSTGTDSFTIASPQISSHKNPPPHLKIEPPPPHQASPRERAQPIPASSALIKASTSSRRCWLKKWSPGNICTRQPARVCRSHWINSAGVVSGSLVPPRTMSGRSAGPEPRHT